MKRRSCKLAKTPQPPEQPRLLRHNWSKRIVGKRAVLILVISFVTAILLWLEVLKGGPAPLQESYVVLPVFSMDSELYGVQTERKGQCLTCNTTRRLLMSNPFDIIPPPRDIYIPPWESGINSWQVHRHLSEGAFLAVKMRVANVSFILDLDFRSDLMWINCKWEATNSEGKFSWTKLFDNFKPSQLIGPNGLYVPVNMSENWCDTRLCRCLKSAADLSRPCDTGLCHFRHAFGKEEIIEGVLLRDKFVLSNRGIPANDTKYRTETLAVGCVHNRRSAVTGKRLKSKGKLRSDGVLGLNQYPLSFPSQLFEKGIAQHYIVLCLANTTGVKAGYIIFGYPVSIIGKAVTWVRLLPPWDRGSHQVESDMGSYQVEFDSILYGDKTIMLSRYSNITHRLILDGSSRFTYLEPAIFNAFVKTVGNWIEERGYIPQQIEDEEGTCWSFIKPTTPDYKLIRGLGNVTFLLGDYKELVIKPENFVISPAEGLVCLAIRSITGFRKQHFNILGGMALKGNIFVVDKINSRLGWMADETCDISRLEVVKKKQLTRSHTV